MNTLKNWNYDHEKAYVTSPDPQGKWDDAGNVEGYKGYLICESVAGRGIGDLISAAPDLLAALTHLVRWHDQLGPTDIAKAKAAIAKAEGGSL